MDDFEKTLKRLERKLWLCFGKERHLIRRDIYRLRQKMLKKEPDLKDGGAFLAGLEYRVKRSIERCDLRSKSIPDFSWLSGLPVTARKDEIIKGIRDNSVLILSGETGSGKTTQIPKFCLAAGLGKRGIIACTQPRRIAAVSVAERIAEELGEETGKTVGYQIRFQEKITENTLISVMTDGILLAEAQKDRFLSAYDAVIVDEAHERSLNIDFILGFLLNLLKKRKDLKVIVTSATIDTEKFSRAFNNAPVIEVSGRTFPVDTVYRPSEDREEEEQYVDRAVEVVEEINGQGPFGDILIFMPTEADIRECCEQLNGRSWLHAEVMPLFARMSASDQKKIFEPVAARKIIVATNVAETSITIPGIKYVIDTGLARIPRYTPRTGTTSLPVTTISKSSADQRKGRAGRVENGICYRLFSESEYEARPHFTTPHILRANLAEVILRMMSLKLGDISRFTFIDPPSDRSVKDGFNTLVELGAIKKEDTGKEKNSNGYVLTERGRIMARIPLDPTLSRMLIESHKRGCSEEVIVIVSALSIRDPRERPQDRAQQADQAQAIFKDPSSDFITLLNIWNAWKRETHEKGGRKASVLRQFCKAHYLSFLRMREWQDIYSQLIEVLSEQDISKEKSITESDDENKRSPFKQLYRAIHKSLLSGYLSGIAVKKEKNIYTAARGREVMIFPGSGLFNKGGPWIMAAEMVETSRLFARTTALIEPKWLVELGGDSLVKRYGNPRWDRKRGAVVATEIVSIFGLVLTENTVLYGRFKPVESSGIFIQRALVEGDIDTGRIGRELSFIRHNLELAEKIRKIEDRIRRRDLLVADEILVEFYEKNLTSISDIRTLSRFVKEKGGDNFLKMTEDMLLRYEPARKELALYPEALAIGGTTLKVDYRFSPGGADDGITLSVPMIKVGAVNSEALDWLVPGLVQEKIEVMIKGLPKEYRRRLVPVSTTASVVACELPELKKTRASGKSPVASIETALSKFILTRFGVDIPLSAWSIDQVPDYLSMRLKITDEKGRVVAEGRDKTLLSHDFSVGKNDDLFEKAKKRFEIDDVSFDTVENVPETVSLDIGPDRAIAFPGFMVEGEKVSLRLFRSRQTADENHEKAVKFLFEKRLADSLKALRKDMVLKGRHCLMAESFGGDRAFSKKMTVRVLSELFILNIRSGHQFEEQVKNRAGLIHETGRKVYSVSISVLEAYHEAISLIHSLELKEIAAKRTADAGLDFRKELDHLVPTDFLLLYNYDRLFHLTRYIRAIRLRAQRAFDNPDKDRFKAAEVKPFIDILNGFLNGLDNTHPKERRNRIEDFFWLIEEFKVSVFAPELKTSVKVSEKRLHALADEIRKIV